MRMSAFSSARPQVPRKCVSPSLILLAAALFARQANAQVAASLVAAPSVPFPRAEFASVPDVGHLADATTLRRVQATDYRWEGFGIGAVGLGLFGAYAGHEFCANSEDRDKSCAVPTIAVGLIGALVGGVTGGLIGGLITRH